MVFKRRPRRSGGRGSQLPRNDAIGPANSRPPRKKIKKIPAGMVQQLLQKGASGDGDDAGDGEQQQADQAVEQEQEVSTRHYLPFFSTRHLSHSPTRARTGYRTTILHRRANCRFW